MLLQLVLTFDTHWKRVHRGRTLQIPTTPAARAQTVQLDDLHEAFYCAFCVILVTMESCWYGEGLAQLMWSPSVQSFLYGSAQRNHR